MSLEIDAPCLKSIMVSKSEIHLMAINFLGNTAVNMIVFVPQREKNVHFVSDCITRYKHTCKSYAHMHL